MSRSNHIALSRASKAFEYQSFHYEYVPEATIKGVVIGRSVEISNLGRLLAQMGLGTCSPS